MLRSNVEEIIRDGLKFPEHTKYLQQRGLADYFEASCNELIKVSFSHAQLPQSRRCVEDITVGDTYIDHKTTDEALSFKMPNLISIDRLKKLDRDLLYNFVIYNSVSKSVTSNFAIYIHEINWDHLAIQNLGSGQLQIKNMSRFIDTPRGSISKTEWYARLREEALRFYDHLLSKTARRRETWK